MMSLLSATVLCFTGAIAAYIVSAVIALVYRRVQTDGTLRGANAAMAIGSGLLVMVFALRAAHWGLVPLTNAVESMNLFLLLTTVVIFFVLRDRSMRPLQIYYAPTLAVIGVIALLVSRGFYAEKPLAMNSLFLTVHVGLACLAYALFLITVILGAVWATSGVQEGLSETWWLSPKFAHSVVTTVFFAAAVHARQLGWLRGRKYANFVFYGFAIVLISFVGLRLLGLRDYNFWVAGS